jgi:hypothetical protein
MTALAAAQPDPTWRDLLAQQDGVISRRQARACGLSEDQWQWFLDSGRWQSVLLGVAVAHSGEVTDRQRAWAAVLSAGEGAHLTGEMALIVHGMRLKAPRDVHLAVPRELIPRRFLVGEQEARGRTVPHLLTRLTTWTHPVKQPPVLRVAPAVLHAAAYAPSDRAAEWRLAATVQQGLTRAPELRTTCDEMPRLRRRSLIGEVLDDIEFGAHAASELDLLRFLRRHQLPMPDRLQRPVRRGKVRYLDAWWDKQRVNAEMDGAHHRLVGTWDDDALRANDVVLVERHDRILLLRFTRGNLRHDGPRVAAQLGDALL